MTSRGPFQPKTFYDAMILRFYDSLHQFVPQSVLIPGITLTDVHDLALDLIELHDTYKGPLPKAFKIPLDGIPSL